jgi:hypothetical protein
MGKIFLFFLNFKDFKYVYLLQLQRSNFRRLVASGESFGPKRRREINCILESANDFGLKDVEEFTGQVTMTDQAFDTRYVILIKYFNFSLPT